MILIDIISSHRTCGVIIASYEKSWDVKLDKMGLELNLLFSKRSIARINISAVIEQNIIKKANIKGV